MASFDGPVLRDPACGILCSRLRHPPPSLYNRNLSAALRILCTPPSLVNALLDTRGGGAHSEGDVCSSVEVSWRRRHHCADFEEFGRHRKHGTRSAQLPNERKLPEDARSGVLGRTVDQGRGTAASGRRVGSASVRGAAAKSSACGRSCISSPRRDLVSSIVSLDTCETRLRRGLQAKEPEAQLATSVAADDELKLEIEALKLQLEIEKVKTARFLQNAAQARSETSGLGRYAKDLKAVLVPMPAEDTMIPAWFKMADSLLKMLEEVKRSVVSQSLSGTCSYGTLMEKVLKELKLTPTEYRRCFPEIKKEVREQSCNRTKLTASFGKVVTADVRCVPVGLPCPSGNAQRVSLLCAGTPELTSTSADVLLTPGNHESPCFAMSLSEPKLEGNNCGLAEKSTEQDRGTRSVKNRTKEARKTCLGATLEPTHESEKEVRVEMSVRGEANPDLGYREQASAAVGAAGGPAQERQSRRCQHWQRHVRGQRKRSAIVLLVRRTETRAVLLFSVRSKCPRMRKSPQPNGVRLRQYGQRRPLAGGSSA
ncbi:hypothetical protein HPB50_025629 [Hyalomma asiaticum]|uniref:Uncharacterized protein n=1 Tax=Hyalomma asiaticum TaxID=266040 RepID=A0ACB7TFT4_HYAAI|nr:hypothetical protein HPB50_025629 [Hyalomma asiaticum]